MANFSAGSASVDISPNFDEFVRKLRDDLDRVNGDLSVEINPDMSGFAEKLKAELSGGTVSVKVDPDITGFSEKLDAYMSGLNPTLTVDVSPSLTGFVGELESQLAAIDLSGIADQLNQKLQISPTVDSPAGQLNIDTARIAAQLDEITRDRRIHISLDVDWLPIIAAVAALIALRRLVTINVEIPVNDIIATDAALAQLARNRTAHIHAELDESTALAAAARLDTIARNRRVELNVDSAALAGLTALGSHTVNLDVQINQASLDAVNTELAHLARDRTVTFYPDVDASSAAALEAILARLARRRSVEFGLSLDAAEAARMEILLRLLGRNRNVQFGVEGLGGLGAVRSQSEAASRSLTAMSSIRFAGLAAGIGALVPILIGAVGAAGGLAAALGLIVGAGAIGGSGITGAFSAMKDASSGAAAASKQHAEDLNAVTDAQQRVIDAQHNEKDSLQSVEDAQKSLTQARIDAKDAIDNLNLSVKDGALTERGSELAYRRAVVNLQKVRTQAGQGKATGLDVETAQLEVDQAAQNITDTRVRNAQTKVKADNANSKGVEGSDQVVGAQRSLEQSQYGVQQAQIATAQAVRELAKAQQEAAKSANEAAGGTDKLAQALAKLSPSARDFVLQMQALGPQWTELRKAVQENLFTGLGDSVTTLAHNQLPALKDGLSQLATGMNTAVKSTLSSLDGLFTQLVNNGTMKAFVDGTSAALQGMAPLVTGLASAFIQLGGIVGPHLAPLFAALGPMIAQLAGPLGQLGGSFIDTLTSILPTLTTLISSLATGLAPVLPIVGRLLDAVGQALIPLIGPISQIAQVVGNALVVAINALAPYLPTIAQAFADILVAVAPLIGPLAQLIGLFAGTIAQNVSALAVALTPVIEQLAVGLAPVIPIIASTLAQLTPIFAQMATTVGQALVQALEKILPVLPGLIQSWADLLIALLPLLPTLVDLAVQILPILADILVRVAPLIIDLLHVVTDLVNFIVPILVPALEKWRDIIESVWEHVRGAFDGMKSALGELKDKFLDVVEKIKEAWKGLTEVFKVGGLGGLAGKAVDKALELLPGHADGGPVSGPGTGTSDSIVARLSHGEFVVNAASARRYLPLVQAINDGTLPGYAEGGLVGDAKNDADVKQAQAAIGQLAELSKQAYQAGDTEKAQQYSSQAQQIAQRLRIAGGAAQASGATQGSAIVDSGAAAVGAGNFGGDVDKSLWTVIHGKFPNATLNSAYRPGDKGFHGIGEAIDVGGPLADVANFAFGLKDQLAQIIYSGGPLWYNVRKNQVGTGIATADGNGAAQIYGPKTISEHSDHVHLAAEAAIAGATTSASAAPASPQAANDPSNYSPTGTYVGPGGVDTTKDLQEAKKDELPQQYTLQGIFSKAGSILATGLLSAVGLEGSVLSENNVYNKAVNTTVDYYTKKQQDQAAGAGTTASIPSSTPETEAPIVAAPGVAAKHVYDPKASAEQWRGTVVGVLQGTGRDLELANRTLAQIGIESNGNPNATNNTDINAQNGTPSIGLLQVIKPTFDANVDSRYPGTQKDPEPNIAAALNYVDKRYQGAAKIWPTTAGYALGGLVSGDGTGTSDSILARVSHGEFITNANATAANLDVLQAINAGTSLRAPALPAGFGVRGGDSRVTNRDHSLNFHGDNYMMNPQDFVDEVDRQQSKQAIGLSAALP